MGDTISYGPSLVPEVSAIDARNYSPYLSTLLRLGYCAGGGVAEASRMPVESKTNVLTSASAPVAGISWPFQRKVTPAALPTLTMISRVARTEVFAGAKRVSCLTGWPSARTEIQEVSVARMARVRGGVEFSEGARVDFCGAGSVALLLPAALSSLALSAVVAEGGAGASAGG